MDFRPHIEKFRRRFAEVEALLSDPKVFDNAQRAQELSREYARLKDLVAGGESYLQTQVQLAENRALLASEPAESELAPMAREEIARLEAEETRLGQQLQFGLVAPDPTDSRNTIVEIRAGAGGSESALFAADLYRMYALCRDAGLESRDDGCQPVRPRRLQGNCLPNQRAGRLQAAQARERRASRAARSGDRGAGSHPYQHGDRGRSARGAGGGH